MTATNCCKARCTELFTANQISESRSIVAELTDSQKTKWLMKFFETNMNTDSPAVDYLVSGVSVCQLAFCRVYGVSVNKVIQCKQQFLAGAKAHMHGNCFRVYDSPKRDSVAAWIQNYCDAYGDYVPTKNEIHLPSHLT